MSRRPASVLELPGYRRRADQLLTAEEQDAIVDLIAYEPTSFRALAACARFESDAAAAANEVERG